MKGDGSCPVGDAMREIVAARLRPGRIPNDLSSQFSPTLATGQVLGFDLSDPIEQWPEIVVRHLRQPVCILGRGCCFEGR